MVSGSGQLLIPGGAGSYFLITSTPTTTFGHTCIIISCSLLCLSPSMTFLNLQFVCCASNRIHRPNVIEYNIFNNDWIITSLDDFTLYRDIRSLQKM